MSFVHQPTPEEITIHFERLYLEEVIIHYNTGDSAFKRYVDRYIQETINYCMGKTDIYSVDRSMYYLVMRWSVDSEFFMNLRDVKEYQLKDYLHIRNYSFYGEKMKHRISAIQDVLDDE
jgi:hypothetical protein